MEILVQRDDTFLYFETVEECAIHFGVEVEKVRNNEIDNWEIVE